MTKIKSEAAIYGVIETAMESLTAPITCSSLLDIPDVRAAAVDRFGNDLQLVNNKLSDMLGFMWRRGVLERYPASDSTTKARFAYLWKKRPLVEARPIQNAKSPVISERADGIHIEFEHFTVVVRPK